MSAFLWIFGTGFIGAHIGWYMMQQRYIPENQRHHHPFVKWYLRYMKPKSIDE